MLFKLLWVPVAILGLGTVSCRTSKDSSDPKILMELDPVEVEIDDPEPAPLLGPDPSGTATKYPVVIANGLISDGSTLQPVIDALRADGHKVYMTSVPAAHPIRIRIQELKPQIDKILAESRATKINIIAYSMGALDARHLASSAGYARRIASITFVSGVNHGTPAGSAAYKILQTMPENWREKIDAFTSLVGVKFLNPQLAKAELTELAHDISLEYAQTFARENPDMAGIYYQSYAGLSSLRGRPVADAENVCGKILGDGKVHDSMNLALYLSMKLLVPEIDKIPSDGAIPVSSQKHGLFRGCVPIDHWGIIGSSRAAGPNLYTGFDVVRFYRNVVFELAAKGF